VDKREVLRGFFPHIFRRALAIVPLSAVGAVLFFAAQGTSRSQLSDHRHVDAWLSWTAALAFSWLVASILEYNRRRGRRTEVGRG
jgi:hypothetical protein